MPSAAVRSDHRLLWAVSVSTALAQVLELALAPATTADDEAGATASPSDDDAPLDAGGALEMLLRAAPAAAVPATPPACVSLGVATLPLEACSPFVDGLLE